MVHEKKDLPSPHMGTVNRILRKIKYERWVPVRNSQGDALGIHTYHRQAWRQGVSRKRRKKKNEKANRVAGCSPFSAGLTAPHRHADATTHEKRGCMLLFRIRSGYSSKYVPLVWYLARMIGSRTNVIAYRVIACCFPSAPPLPALPVDRRDVRERLELALCRLGL